MDKAVYQILMQMFNHQTHHRGSIAIILDKLGIENHFADLIGLPD
jgi:uncharacterized damage-inducible protein DinB